MTFEELLDSIIGDTTAKANALLDMWEADDIDDDTFAGALVVLVDRSRGRGANAAVGVLRSYVESGLGSPVLVTPVLPETAQDRLGRAVGTILGSDLDTRMQVDRLAAGETLGAAHRAYDDTMAATPQISGWTRGLNSDACELCRWWSRGGKVWPATHTMPTHTGCKCHPVPTLKEKRNG